MSAGARHRGTHSAPRRRLKRRERARRRIDLSSLALACLAIVVIGLVVISLDTSRPDPAPSAVAVNGGNAVTPEPDTSPATKESASTSKIAPIDPPLEPQPPSPRPVPESGTGIFIAASSQGTTAAASRTYSVEVEDVLPFATERFAEQVQGILSDDRGWSSGGFTFRRTEPAEAGFRIVLAAPQTVDSLCAPLLTRGRLSCRNGSTVVINAYRWAQGAESYGRDLGGYRAYLVNHEVGHLLGYGHVDCPAPGASAPVMLQQTKGLNGCTKNPWPGVVDLG